MEKVSELRVWEGTVLNVPNHHVESCGKPPQLQASGCYTSYFENIYGEQMVFQYDYKSKKGTLWCGDASWEEPVSIFDGVAPGIILSEKESAWLHLCWETATYFEPEAVKLASRLALARAFQAQYQKLRTVEGLEDLSKHFQREIHKWQKEEKAILEKLEKLQALEEAEKIIKGKWQC